MHMLIETLEICCGREAATQLNADPYVLLSKHGSDRWEDFGPYGQI